MIKQQKLSIKNWDEADRPREKLLEKGIESLSNAELIAIIIGSGNTEESAVDVAKKILISYGNNLNELGKSNVNNLKTFKGIGEAKAINIIAALEIGRRYRVSEIIKKPGISGSSDVYNVFKPLISHIPHEEFWVLYLNRSNKIISKNRISKGGVAGTVIDIKIIFKTAIEHLASSIIIVHNHPSGNLMPSENDIKITNKMKEAGKLVDIPVIDHLIISEAGFYSFADEGKI